MKKIVAVILIMLLALSLFACGASESNEIEAVPSEAELKLQAEQQTFDSVAALVEEGRYDEAIEVLSNIESFKKVADKIEEISTLKEEAEKAAAEAELAARPRKEIEITIENWSDYFEFTQIPEYDSFGDLALIRHLLVPKQEYADIIAYQDPFNIDIAYKGVGTTASVEIADDGSFIYGKALPGWGGQMFLDEVLSLSNNTLESITNYVYHNGEVPFDGILENDGIYHESGMNGCNEWVFTLEKVQGVLIVFS